MRTLTKGYFLAAGALLVIAVACRGGRESIASLASPPLGAAAPTSIVETPIGPVPGQNEATVSQATNPYHADEAAALDGRHLFNSFNCAGCHGDHGGGGMGPSLRDEDWIYGDSEARIASSIAGGRAHGMPAWGTKLTSDQVWKLATYIKSLRTSAEPEPPAGN